MPEKKVKGLKQGLLAKQDMETDELVGYLLDARQDFIWGLEHCNPPLSEEMIQRETATYDKAVQRVLVEKAGTPEGGQEVMPEMLPELNPDITSEVEPEREEEMEQDRGQEDREDETQAAFDRRALSSLELGEDLSGEASGDWSDDWSDDWSNDWSDNNSPQTQSSAPDSDLEPGRDTDHGGSGDLVKGPEEWPENRCNTDPDTWPDSLPDIMPDSRSDDNKGEDKAKEKGGVERGNGKFTAYDGDPITNEIGDNEIPNNVIGKPEIGQPEIRQPEMVQPEMGQDMIGQDAIDKYVEEDDPSIGGFLGLIVGLMVLTIYIFLPLLALATPLLTPAMAWTELINIGLLSGLVLIAIFFCSLFSRYRFRYPLYAAVVFFALSFGAHRVEVVRNFAEGERIVLPLVAEQLVEGYFLLAEMTQWPLKSGAVRLNPNELNYNRQERQMAFEKEMDAWLER